MKYMGSKRAMLANGLGNLLKRRAAKASRVVDLFCGSAAVSWFAAQETKVPVLAVDLQQYSTVLASAVLSRTQALKSDEIAKRWITAARLSQVADAGYFQSFALENKANSASEIAKKGRKLCKELGLGPMWQAYGGYYYSPSQAIAFDALRSCIPDEEPGRSACLAALIIAASKCAASPGHTAQPLRPSKSSEHSIREAWKHDPFALAYRALLKISERFSNVRGEALKGDAVKLSSTLKSDDLVFVDPPYSGVQYSRFYHVLEALTVGKPISVSGEGRYPPLQERPQSSFSNKGQSQDAMRSLLDGLAQSACTVLLTFPNSECSNGLSANLILSIARDKFKIGLKKIVTSFSTLGGNNKKRKARLKCEELILVLQPR